jgi:hypothetical protein
MSAVGKKRSWQRLHRMSVVGCKADDIHMDGVVEASAALDGKVSLSRGIIQLAGDAIVCDIEALKSTALKSPQLLSLLIRHEQTV